MGTKENPGAYDCHAKAAPDEPTFTLLARDIAAPATIEHWAMLRMIDIAHGRKPESDMAKVRGALECADAMRAWYSRNRAACSVGQALNSHGPLGSFATTKPGDA